jgi:alkylation response protein AidB-like acyl-CoA dehydrogenase
MYLAPEGDELEIANAAADFIADALPISRLHEGRGPDMDADLRASLGEMGWFALALPEDRGGSGLSAVEHALFFREVGRQCGPLDVLAQALACHCEQDEVLRAALVSGEQSVALLMPDGTGHRLIGAGEARFGLAVSSGTSSLYDLARVEIEPRPALDPANSLAVVSGLGFAAATSEDARIWQLGQVGAAAMLLGLAEAALDLIVDYAKVRETFGKPIGAWQAVRHTCADMAVANEGARAQLWYAATALKEGRGDAVAHLDAAKHLANEAALFATDSTIQLHGGIGVTDEHNAHLLMKHAALRSRLVGHRNALLANLLHAELED